MVKRSKKDHKLPTNTINSVLSENKILPKSRQQINLDNYQKNKAKIKARQKERYDQKKEQERQQLNKYYQANSIKVLMSLKDYTELNQTKRKFWMDFNWALKETSKNIHDIIDIMKLRETADNLIKDYWATAKSEIQKGKSWNTLSEEKQTKLIKYWGREKVRLENELTNNLAVQNKQADLLEKEIELAKFHEERGKVKCSCYDCEAKKEILAKIKKVKQEIDKVKCLECQKWVKKLNKDSGICPSCLKKYE